jgi:hypothetical protein
MTFRHLADHLIQDELPYPVYSEKSTRVPVIGKDGKKHVLLTKALNRDLSCNHLRLLDRMAREGLLTTARVGAVRCRWCESKRMLTPITASTDRE